MHEIALVDTEGRVRRTAAQMTRHPTRMPSDGSTRACTRDMFSYGGCPAPLGNPDECPGKTRRLSAPRGTMERFDRRLHVRVSASDIERA